MKEEPNKKSQAEIKNKNLKSDLKKSGAKTQIKGHLKATNQRNQAKRDSKG